MSLPSELSPALNDGVVLCYLANHVKPRSVASIHVPSPAVVNINKTKSIQGPMWRDPLPHMPILHLKREHTAFAHAD